MFVYLFFYLINNFLLNSYATEEFYFIILIGAVALNDVADQTNFPPIKSWILTVIHMSSK